MPAVPTSIPVMARCGHGCRTDARRASDGLGAGYCFRTGDRLGPGDRPVPVTVPVTGKAQFRSRRQSPLPPGDSHGPSDGDGRSRRDRERHCRCDDCLRSHGLGHRVTAPLAATPRPRLRQCSRAATPGPVLRGAPELAVCRHFGRWSGVDARDFRPVGCPDM